MRYLVTGGCGFIGSHLVDNLLSEKGDVIIVDNLLRGRYLWHGKGLQPTLLECDICDHETVVHAIRDTRPEVVFHLAAHHYIPFCEQNPHDAIRTNVGGTANVVEACAKTGSVEKLFFASTGDVYAPCSYAHRELDQVSPVYVYGETKLMGEQLLRRYKSSVQVRFDITIGRLFNATGPRETNPHLLPEVVRQLTAGAQSVEVGNTWPFRDFVDVRSMAYVIRRLTERARGIDVFNIGSGAVQSVQQALQTLIDASGRAVSLVSVEARRRPNDRPYLCPNVDKLIGALGSACSGFSSHTAKAIWDEPETTRLLY